MTKQKSRALLQKLHFSTAYVFNVCTYIGTESAADTQRKWINSTSGIVYMFVISWPVNNISRSAMWRHVYDLSPYQLSHAVTDDSGSVPDHSYKRLTMSQIHVSASCCNIVTVSSRHLCE
jgi:hypothetical protein